MWIIIVNGFQWGHDATQFDHRIGCSRQTYPSKAAAATAWRRARAAGSRGIVEYVAAA